MADFAYQGGELELFAHARNWKRYFASHLAPFIRGRTLEVGAGIGGTTAVLCGKGVTSWTALEPDPVLASRYRQPGRLPVKPRVVVGTLADLPQEERFDTILYIDVMEHIEDDRAEMARAAARLAPGGHLVVLCPAHQSLYTPFDKAIGHFRRYDRPMFRALTPAGTRIVALRYLDSAGMLLSLANRLLLRTAMPTWSQILVWDRLFVPCSSLTDWLLGGHVGKTVIGVWAKGGGHG